MGTAITRFPEKIQGKFAIDAEFYRSLAKMALTFGATLISPERLRDGSFFTIRDFINGESLNNDFVKIESSEIFPALPKIDQLNHRIFFFSSEEQRRALGLIELFGHFRFSVQLSNSWTGKSLAKAHVINPVTHERYDTDTPIVAGMFDQVDQLSDEQKVNAIQRAITSVNTIIRNRQRDARISQIVETTLNVGEAGADRQISEEDFQKAVERASLKLSQFLARQPTEEQIDLSAYQDAQDHERGE